MDFAVTAGALSEAPAMSYFEQGQWGLMLTNIVTNNLFCLGGALAAMASARAL